MTHHGPGGSSGEPPVGHEGHVVAKALADQRAGNAQHLLHTRTAFGSFVADYFDVSGFYFLPLDGLEGG